MSADADTDEAAESTERDVPDDLPPSASHVLFVLRERGALSASDLHSTAYLPESTARKGVRRLVDAGLVERRTDPEDTRRRIYVPL